MSLLGVFYFQNPSTFSIEFSSKLYLFHIDVCKHGAMRSIASVMLRI
jgi:hypothetical protein